MTLGWMMIVVVVVVVVVVGGGNVQDTKVEQSTNGIDCRRLGVLVVGGHAFTGRNRGVGVAPQDGAQTMNGHEQSMIIGMWWWWWR